MRVNWRVGVLVALFFLQFAFVVVQDRLFNQAMEVKREWVQKDAIEAGAPERQARVISSAVREVNYEVSSYVRNVVWQSLTFNFVMLIVVLSIRQREVS